MADILSAMEREVADQEAAPEELVHEPVADHALDRAVGLVLESLRRRAPERTIR